MLKNNASILFAIRSGSEENLEPLIQENVSIVSALLSGDVEEREGRLSFAIEKFAEIRLLNVFFSEGILASQAQVLPCNDEEYLGTYMFNIITIL